MARTSIPLEVEETLNAHDAVREVAVVGVDDEKYGQRLAAFVVLGDGEDATADDLKQHVKRQLAGYKVPRDVTFLDELPRNASGKVVTRELTAADGLTVERMAGVDAGYLYMETPTMHMHTLKIALVEPGEPFDFDRLTARAARPPAPAPAVQQAGPAGAVRAQPPALDRRPRDRPGPAHLPPPGARRPAAWRRWSG